MCTVGRFLFLSFLSSTSRVPCIVVVPVRWRNCAEQWRKNCKKPPLGKLFPSSENCAYFSAGVKLKVKVVFSGDGRVRPRTGSVEAWPDLCVPDRVGVSWRPWSGGKMSYADRSTPYRSVYHQQYHRETPPSHRQGGGGGGGVAGGGRSGPAPIASVEDLSVASFDMASPRDDPRISATASMTTGKN